jgi:hypothetical protein
VGNFSKAPKPDLTCGWLLAPNFELIGEYQRSLKEYPNIKTGEDFKGYS